MTAGLRRVLAAWALVCVPVVHAAAVEEAQASMARYDGIDAGVALFAHGYHLRAFCSRYPTAAAALRAAVAEFEAAYPDLVRHAKEEPWFGMVGDSVVASLSLTDDPDDIFHSAERYANSAGTVHKLATDPGARALFLAWRFPQPAGTPSAGAP
ncbi:acyltransferase [Ralstonia nicotianae]|uniref:acyltransferase n=1 Tax=Ralstonia pseudosolanacearum TaxID=1310165 RepID=UPI000E589E49|nr:acyltransferase [Ralstonia pseudosolanacearum]AXV75134.1 acyltransferase [Ralstonia solanacearum]AXW16890.1 acyltransferase [Ralstonia solanacearum]AXW40974.1 acyltransferase [Ralstonia solanacearum]AXW73767.1 acyltransferase [Ralstonia solanacearum]MCK4127686.1 acyltransferase [Ralstonia pseudosolanacearum]